MQDLMLKDNGKYICSAWCDNGEVDVRGEFCWACRFDEANHLILNCAQQYYDYVVDMEDDQLIEYAIDELFDAIERKQALTAEYNERN